MILNGVAQAVTTAGDPDRTVLTAKLDDTIEVQLTSSDEFETTVSATLAVGESTDTFEITTCAPVVCLPDGIFVATTGNTSNLGTQDAPLASIQAAIEFAASIDLTDPLALIEFLERLSEHERKGNLPKVFSSHPMSKERIKRAQEEIAQVLPARTDYVVSTSRFDQVKARLLHWRHVNSLYEPSEQGGPRLRRRTQESQP